MFGNFNSRGEEQNISGVYCLSKSQYGLQLQSQGERIIFVLRDKAECRIENHLYQFVLVTIYFSFSSGKISNYCKDPDKKVYGLVGDGKTNSLHQTLYSLKHYYFPDSGVKRFQVDTEKIDDEKTKCHVKSKGRRFIKKNKNSQLFYACFHLKVNRELTNCLIIGFR